MKKTLNNRKRLLSAGEKVYILWNQEKGFINEEAFFLSYVNYKNQNVPVFQIDNNKIFGSECFWIEKKRIKSQKDIEKYQSLINPIQAHIKYLCLKDEIQPIEKIKNEEIDKMVEEKVKSQNKLQAFMNKYGFDPTNEEWIENHLGDNEIEKSWFKYIRELKLPIIDQTLVDKFNFDNKCNIDLKTAKDMALKRMRYSFGAFPTRLKGINDIAQWIKEAMEFEEKSRTREQRMKDWNLSRNGHFPLVVSKTPIEFWSGNHFFDCLEKIPEIFTSPDCNYIKSDTVFEVRYYDKKERFINLDFVPEIREKLTGSKEPKEDSTYSIIVYPDKIEETLDGLEQL